jgi:hypothetical protein
MRTKTLLLVAGAALVLSLTPSQAQSVYSANVVGYIQLNLTNGFNLIANQLDVDGTGLNNTVVTVFGTNLPANSAVLAWVPSSGSFSFANWTLSKGVLKWSGATNAANQALNPGGAVFVSIPASAPATTTITLVGNVIQGTNVVPMVTGFNMAGAIPPLSGSIDTNLNYIPSHNDQVLVWSPATQSYVFYNYTLSKGVWKWSPGSPQISLAQGVFINTTNTTPAWTNKFVVSP